MNIIIVGMFTSSELVAATNRSALPAPASRRVAADTLVFEPSEAHWYLVGIVHGEWTI